MEYAKKVQNEVIKYYTSMDKAIPSVAEHSRNLNLMYMQGKIKPVYHREDIVTTVSKILLRISKPNVLLTGVAGCGKTAIAEALAIACAEKALAYKEEQMRLQKAYEKAHKEWMENFEGNEPQWVEPKKTPLADYIVYDLSMNSLIGGTQYRGQFEERIGKMLKELSGEKRIVLFIDEIHQMNSLGGHKSEGEPTFGQILKPALARGDIIVIGATTDEEAPILLQDKALARRFTQVNVSELKGEGAKKTADGIFADYLKAHEIKADTALADTILQMINYYLPKTTFPDNFINVVDETLAGARYDELKEVNLDHFKATIGRMAGVIIVQPFFWQALLAQLGGSAYFFWTAQGRMFLGRIRDFAQLRHFSAGILCAICHLAFSRICAIMGSVRGAISRKAQAKKTLKKVKKPLDKPNGICYNIYVIKRANCSKRKENCYG